MSGRRRRNREAGQDLVEWAIVLPLLLLLILGIIECAIIVFSYDTIANAAREGARVGIVPGATEDDVLQAVLERALALNLSTEDITITMGEIIRVEVDYEVHLMIGPIIAAMGGNPTLPMQAVASMRAE